MLDPKVVPFTNDDVLILLCHYAGQTVIIIRANRIISSLQGVKTSPFKGFVILR